MFQSPSPNNRSDAPSDDNKASLKETLLWLKRELPKLAAEDRSIMGDRLNFEFTSVTSCNIEWRLRPHIEPDIEGRPPNPTPVTPYYSVDLKNLDPASVKVTPAGSLRLSTHNGEHAIRLVYRDDSTGRVNQFMTPKPLDSASIFLKKNASTAELIEAFRHAIKLCQ